jgi:hypothetical protein
MTRALGFTLLAAAWAVVIVGALRPGIRIPWISPWFFEGTAPLAYLSAPILLGALYFLLRGLRPGPPASRD